MADLHVFESFQALRPAAVAAIAAAGAEAIERDGMFRVALTGGGVAEEIYPALAEVAGTLDWARTSVWWGDERRVPPGHPDSNYRLARETLLEHVPLPPANVHRMRGEAADAEAAAREYERLLPEAFDLVLLGLGPDGHICSLFPGHPAVAETRRKVVPVENSPKPPPDRLTITQPVLHAARKLLVIAWGSGKAEAVARALEDGPADEVPARLARDGTWIIDRAAASRIRG